MNMNTEDLENLVNRIKKLCDLKDVKINKCLSDCNLDKNVLTNMKKSVPSVDKIMTLAEYFNVSIDYLLTGKSDSQKTSNVLAVPELRQYRWDFKAKDDISKLYNHVCRSIYTLHSDLVASVLLSAIALPAKKPCEIDENKLKWLAIHSETSPAFFHDFHDERPAAHTYRMLRETANNYAREGVMSLEELKQNCPEAELWECNYNSLCSEAIRLTTKNEYIGEIFDMFANCHSEAEQGELMTFIRKGFKEFREDQYSRMSKTSEARASISIPIPKK